MSFVQQWIGAVHKVLRVTLVAGASFAALCLVLGLLILMFAQHEFVVLLLYLQFYAFAFVMLPATVTVLLLAVYSRFVGKNPLRLLRTEGLLLLAYVLLAALFTGLAGLAG